MNIEEVADLSLVLKAVLTISDEGVEAVNVIVSSSGEAAQAKAVGHMLEIAEHIVTIEW